MRGFLRRNGSTILAIISGVGVVVTAVMAVRDDNKAKAKIDKAEREKGDELTMTETAKIVIPTFAPTIAAGTTTILCIVGSGVINRRTQVSIMGAYTLLNHQYRKYRNKIIETFGQEADRNVINDISVNDAEKTDVNALTSVGYLSLRDDEEVEGPTLLFYEPVTKQFFRTTMVQVLNAQYHANRNFALRGFTPFNEYLDFLGVPHTDTSYELGWTPDDGLYWIDFDNHKAKDTLNGEPYWILDAYAYPGIEWREYRYT